MDGHPHREPDEKPESELRGTTEQAALSERIARLQAELTALGGELMALRGEVAALRIASSPPAPTEAVPPIEQQEAAIAIEATSPHLNTASALADESFESQLGTRVLSKIAVVLLLVGAAWFLKWAFDNRWIGPAGRVAAGLLAGAGVILWSERFRRQQMAGFSYALKAVGAGVLYLSLWAGFQLYHLIPAPVAFVAMVAVTAWNVLMAWSQDALLLAGYALLGAYLTPLLLHTGSNHEVFLFGYLLAIAAALLGLLRVKPWSRLLLAALPATAAFFIAWYAEFFDPSQAWRTAGFALLLWAAFAAVPLLTAEPESVIASVLAPLGAGLFGALTIYSVLVDSGGSRWEAWCAAAFALVYLALAAVLRRRSRSLAAAAQLALSIVFLTAAVTLKATGREITLGWLLEAVTLLLAGFWRRLELARWMGLVLLAATILKTFLYDMRNLGTGYRVVSYLGLGALLMAVSFAYQKVWHGLAGADAGGDTARNSGEART